MEIHTKKKLNLKARNNLGVQCVIFCDHYANPLEKLRHKSGHKILTKLQLMTFYYFFLAEAQAKRKRHGYPDLRACVIASSFCCGHSRHNAKESPAKKAIRSRLQSCRFLVLSTETKTLGAFTPVVAFFARSHLWYLSLSFSFVITR